jgi:hypothetical protein
VYTLSLHDALPICAGAARRSNITTAQKQACQAAFDLLAGGTATQLPRQLPEHVRVELMRAQQLAAEQVARQYAAYLSKKSGASGVSDSAPAANSTARAPSGAGAASSAGAAGAGGAAPRAPPSEPHYITPAQRTEMMRVFDAQAPAWGRELPAAAHVNPSELSKPLMDLIRATCLSRSKLVYHYKQFRQQQHRALRTSLDDRRTELRAMVARVTLDVVLNDARRLALAHPIVEFKASVKQCVERLSRGACATDCVARLEQLVELVAEHTVDEFKEVRAAESRLGFAFLASSREWHNAEPPESWVLELGDGADCELGLAANEDAIKDAR